MPLHRPSRSWLVIVVAVVGLGAAAVSRLLFTPGMPDSLVINEVMATNGSVVSDDDDDFEDWIELFNPTAAPISLAAYSLSDSPAQPRMWLLPNVDIPAEGHLLVWASGKSYWYLPDRHPSDPIELEFVSAGWEDGDTVELLLNGDNVAGDEAGLHLAVVERDGTLADTHVFAVHERAAESARLVEVLRSLTVGQVVMIAVTGDGATLADDAVTFLRESLGSQFAHRLDPEDGWGMVAVIGGNLLVEDYRVPGDGAAEGRTRSSPELHAGFRLRQTGDFLGLYDPRGSPVDTLDLGAQARNTSWGRHLDGMPSWCHYTTPTPATPNARSCAPKARTPVTTLAGGYYSEPIDVSLGNSRVSEVHFTLDGSMPTLASELYLGPITLESTTVLRARTYREGFNPSDVISGTYFIDEADVDVSLPTVSLIADPASLFDERDGIYVEGSDADTPNYDQRGMAWERPVTMEFYDSDGIHEFTASAGLRILGNTSREFPKKSFVLYFWPHYGVDGLDYPLFDSTDRERFRSLVLRMGGDDGVQDLPRMRDPLMHTLFGEAGGHASAARPVFLYLNGRPWGIYYLRERIDVDYLVEHVGHADVDLIRESDDVWAGDLRHWERTLAFFETADLNDADDLETARELIDVDNFVDYYLFQIYAGNIDLVEANLVKFRPRIDGGRWRWLMWDVDVSFGLASSSLVTHDTLVWFTRDGARPDLGFYNDDGGDSLWATLILRRLMEADVTRDEVLNRLADLLNTTLSRDHVVDLIDELAARLDPDVAYDLDVWADEWDGSHDGWLDEVEELREFARQRPDVLRGYAGDHYGLEEAVLTVDVPVGGRVRVNSIEVGRSPWTGLYFQHLPVNVVALPDDGFLFAGWSDPSWPQGHGEYRAGTPDQRRASLRAGARAVACAVGQALTWPYTPPFLLVVTG